MVTVCLLQLAVCPLEAAVCWLEALSRLLMGSAVAMSKVSKEMVSTGSEAAVGMSKVLVVKLKVVWLMVSMFSTFSVVLEDCSSVMEDGSGAEMELSLKSCCCPCCWCWGRRCPRWPRG